MSDAARLEPEGSAPASNIGAADMFGHLFARAHCRNTAAADRLIGERMRADADRLGWVLVPKKERADG